jgi:hypothetical protein
MKNDIQTIIEKILQKHNIDSSSESYFIKLSMPNYDDLVIEKEGKQVIIGHYYRHPSGDLISDPVLAFDYNKGNWFPVRIEQTLGDVTCAFCGQEFDVNKRDNSGYIDNKPICAPCREDYGDYL